MPRLGNPLVYDLLEVARGLAGQTGRPNLRKAAMRRAVSSAYYAVFHALCFICASELVGWGRTGLLEPIYRLLDHATVRKRLTGREAAAMVPEILEIGARFAELQEARHLADYSPPALEVHRSEILGLIAAAERIVALIEGLVPDDRARMAVLLIAKPRQT